MSGNERREHDGRRGRGGAGRARAYALAALVAVCLGLCALASHGSGARASDLTSPVGFVRVGLAAQGGGTPSFPHGTPQHARLECDSCHRRADDSPRPALPGHKACADCHIQEFTTADSPLCANCHTALDSRRPPVKGFPALRSFNVLFDHAQHAGGAARPPAGCAGCHAPAARGVALTIPAGLDAHANCYQCHAPGARAGGRDLGSCGACHQPGGYRRTPQTARSFRVGFSHAAHGPRQGLGCADCHSVRAGLPQSRQVSAPLPTQHFGSARAQSCMTCHNNRRAFGGDDFADCKRCHKGQTFRF